MKKLLEEIFSNLKYTYPDFRIIGKDAVLSFDKDRYAKIQFTKYATHGTPNSNVFNGISIDVMDRTKGKLDTQIIAFSDVFGSIFDLNHPNRIGKHVWHNGREYSWYGKPTKKDLNDLYITVSGYLEFAQGKEEYQKIVSELDDRRNDIKIIIEGGMVSSVLSNSQKDWDVEIVDLDALYEEVESDSLREYADSLKKSSEYVEQLYHVPDISKINSDKISFDERISSAQNRTKAFDDKNIVPEIHDKEKE